MTTMETTYELRESGGVPIKSWTRGVPVESEAIQQLSNLARLPIVHRWVAAMPDVHLGIGATVGSVIPTLGAVIPAAVGVDIGCGMLAVQTTLHANDLPDNLAAIRRAIERAVPHGRGKHGGKGDMGSWNDIPNRVGRVWTSLQGDWKRISEKHPAIQKSNHVVHLGTLGTGNHFIEVCLDESQRVWIMLHSGSRGVGNRIGSYFIELAKKDMRRHIANLPDANLAYFEEGSEHFSDYIEAVSWAQSFARHNRELMLDAVLEALQRTPGIPPFQRVEQAVNCHHNYVSKEHHYGKDVFVTRKGAVRARLGELGIIPGCFAAGTRVLMANGLYKNIESVCVGDRVIAGDGSPVAVTGSFAKGVRPTLQYQNNAFHAPSTATGDHLHFVGDMLSADIEEEGRLKILSRPNRDGSSKYGWKPLEQLVPSSHTLLMPREISFSDMPETFSSSLEQLSLVPTYDLGYVFGTFLGDGTAYYERAKGGQVTWAFGLHETSIAEKLAAAIELAVGMRAKAYATKRVQLVVVHSAALARLFDEFGKRDGKAVPVAFWCSNKEYLRGIYDGLIDSDGHVNAKTAKLTNTSARCIEQFGVIHYLLFGYWPSVSTRPPSAGGLRGGTLENYRATSLRLPPLTPKHQLIELLRVNTAVEQEVFDIEVDHPDHSFVANNAIVHNSMGARSFIVRGKGNPEAFESCSHGAGRIMSRTAAKKHFSLDDHERATAGVECRKDQAVIDETPGAYKDIEAVMRAQADLVDIVHTLKQVVCVKG